MLQCNMGICSVSTFTNRELIEKQSIVLWPKVAQFFCFMLTACKTSHKVFMLSSIYDCLHVDTCEPNPCLNGGLCDTTRDGFVCSCPEPYTGKTCQTGRTVYQYSLMWTLFEHLHFHFHCLLTDSGINHSFYYIL